MAAGTTVRSFSPSPVGWQGDGRSGRRASAGESGQVVVNASGIYTVVAEADEPIGPHRQNRHPIDPELIGNRLVDPDDPWIPGPSREANDGIDHRRPLVGHLKSGSQLEDATVALQVLGQDRLGDVLRDTQVEAVAAV